MSKGTMQRFTLIGRLGAEPEVKEPDEITEWRWFSLDNLPTPIFFPSEKILEKYLKAR